MMALASAPLTSELAETEETALPEFLFESISSETAAKDALRSAAAERTKAVVLTTFLPDTAY